MRKLREWFGNTNRGLESPTAGVEPARMMTNADNEKLMGSDRPKWLKEMNQFDREVSDTLASVTGRYGP